MPRTHDHAERWLREPERTLKAFSHQGFPACCKVALADSRVSFAQGDRPMQEKCSQLFSTIVLSPLYKSNVHWPIQQAQCGFSIQSQCSKPWCEQTSISRGPGVKKHLNGRMSTFPWHFLNLQQKQEAYNIDWTQEKGCCVVPCKKPDEKQCSAEAPRQANGRHHSDWNTHAQNQRNKGVFHRTWNLICGKTKPCTSALAGKLIIAIETWIIEAHITCGSSWHLELWPDVSIIKTNLPNLASTGPETV